MNGDQRAAILFHYTGDQPVVFVPVPPQADFSRDRHLERGSQLLECARNLQRSRHHAHTCAAVRNAFGRATHIDINNVWLPLLHKQRGFQDQIRVVTINLKRNRAFCFFVIESFRGFFRAAQNLFHFHELGIAHGRTQCTANGPKGPVRIAVHGREDCVSIDGDLAHMEGGRCL